MGKLARFIHFYTDNNLGNGGDGEPITLTGKIVSFVASKVKAIKSLVVTITPQQDLHGQDSPYPAGGGKNKLDPSLVSVYNEGSAYGLTWTWDSTNGCAHFTGTYSGTGATPAFRILETPSAIRSLNAIGYSSSPNFDLIRWQDGADQLVIKLKNMVQNTSYTFDAYPLIYEGSTAPTAWSPYSNICPITGWTGAKVNVTGVNVWDEEWEVGGIYNTNGNNYSATDRIRSKNYIPCTPNTSYYVLDPTNRDNIDIVFYDENKIYISGAGWGKGAKTTPNNCHFMRFMTSSQYGATYNNDISINYPSTDTEYHAYNPNSTTLFATFPALGKNKLEHQLTSTEHEGVTYVVNADKSITFSGTPSAKTSVYLYRGEFWNGDVTAKFSCSQSSLPTGVRVYCVLTNGESTSYPTLSPSFTLDSAGGIYTNMLLEISTTFNGSPFTIYPQIELGSSASAYEAFDNTVYSVTYDLVSGVGVSDMKSVVFDGSADESWNYETTAAGFKNVYIMISDAKKSQASDTSRIKCNISPITSTPYAQKDKAYISGSGNLNFTWLDTIGISSAADFKTWLTTHNLQVVYELAEPITFTLTPQQINTLQGQNNIFGTGTSVSVTIPSNIIVE